MSREVQAAQACLDQLSGYARAWRARQDFFKKRAHLLSQALALQAEDAARDLTKRDHLSPSLNLNCPEEPRLMQLRNGTEMRCVAGAVKQ